MNFTTRVQMSVAKLTEVCLKKGRSSVWVDVEILLHKQWREEDTQIRPVPIVSKDTVEKMLGLNFWGNKMWVLLRGEVPLFASCKTFRA